MTGPVVIAGATGFIGTHLVARLRALGRDVRCGTRSPASARQRRPDLTWVALDVDAPETLDEALRGASSLVYLVHHLHDGHGALKDAETAAAQRVADAAARAGLQRIVYLGGPQPRGEASSHLAARLATGATLRAGTVPTIELRAAMIVGAGSASWTIVRDLALRLPVMVLPSWLGLHTEPIGLDDVVEALVRALDVPLSGSAAYALPGPASISGRDLLRLVAEQAGFRAAMVELPLITPSLSSHWIRLVTRADHGLARQLVDGLTSDLRSEGPTFWDLCPDLPRTPLDTAIRDALEAEPVGAIPRGGRLWEAAVARLAPRARR